MSDAIVDLRRPNYAAFSDWRANMQMSHSKTLRKMYVTGRVFLKRGII